MADKHNESESEEFRRYREQMHGTEVEEERRPTAAKPIRIAFGIFMIIIYIGMGILLLINFFNYPDETGWLIGRYVVGIVLIIYGLWRAYREVTGMQTRL